MPSLANAASDRNNHFNLIRLLAAIGVLISHSYPIALGHGTPDPLDALIGCSIGELAVELFFAISGFFITGSFDRRKDLAGFIAARVARIFPALCVMLLLTVAVLGPAFTTLPIDRYLASPRTLTYLPRNLSLLFLQWDLPGVFAGNRYPDVINGSLWTLFCEVLCYAMVAVVGSAGALQPRRFAVLLATYLPSALTAMAFGYSPWPLKLSLPFIVGMTLYVFRGSIPVRPDVVLALAGFAWVAKGTILGAFAPGLLLGYGAMWLGHLRLPALLAFNRLGDYSYGTYIYAFPVQQCVAALLPAWGPWQMTAVALPVTLLLAVLSWHLVEEQGLNRREQLAGLLRAMSARSFAGH